MYLFQLGCSECRTCVISCSSPGVTPLTRKAVRYVWNLECRWHVAHINVHSTFCLDGIIQNYVKMQLDMRNKNKTRLPQKHNAMKQKKLHRSAKKGLQTIKTNKQTIKQTKQTKTKQNKKLCIQKIVFFQSFVRKRFGRLKRLTKLHLMFIGDL